MPRKPRAAKPTDLELQQQATEAHHQALAEHLPETSTEFDPAKLDAQPLFPSAPPELVTNHAAPIIQSVADATKMPDEEELEKAKYARREPLAGRDWKQHFDPARKQAVEFPDGFRIHVQESPSRHTVELQFGGGGSRDKPMNYEAIKQVLREENMHWNGECAWVADLKPAPQHRHESEAEKIDRQRHNARIRAHVEDVVFPLVVELEEEKRGPVQSDVIRERINQLASERGR